MLSQGHCKIEGALNERTGTVAVRSRSRRRLLAVWAALPLASVCMSPDARAQASGDMLDVSVTDPLTNRDIGLRVRIPAGEGRAGLIVYSPGLGCGLSAGQAWCEAWQEAGFFVVTLDHPVTGSSLWDTNGTTLRENLARALAVAQYGLRVADCSHVISLCLTTHEISGRVDAQRIGVAGHSFGALTAQSIAGQRLGGQDVSDSRVRAAIAFSPGALSAERAKSMASVHIPFFCVTGDHDSFVTIGSGKEAMVLGSALANRLAVFDNLPRGKRQLLVLTRADHMTFAGAPFDASRYSRDPGVNAAGDPAAWARINAITTPFWQHYLGQGGDPESGRRAMAGRMEKAKLPEDRLVID